MTNFAWSTRNATPKSGPDFVHPNGGLQAVTWSAARVGALSFIPLLARGRENGPLARQRAASKGPAADSPPLGRGTPDQTARQALWHAARRHRGRDLVSPFLCEPVPAKPTGGSGKRTCFWCRKRYRFGCRIPYRKLSTRMQTLRG
jgi:hypothetical protein